MIHGVRGYGHSFPKKYTTWDANVRDSKTHQRIIRYQLGELKVAIRFEADGYLADKVQSQAKTAGAWGQEADEDSLVSALAGSTINAKKHSDSTSLKIKPGSGSIPQSAVFDLKTRTIKKKLDDTTLSDQIPRLWIRQIPSLVLAYHERGFFRSNEVKVHDIKPDIIKWEEDNQRDVRKLIALIKRILDFVKARPSQKMEVRYRDGIGLELREQDTGVKPVLPDDLAARWAGQGKSNVEEAIREVDAKEDKGLEDGSADGGVNLGDKEHGGIKLDDDPDDWDSESEKDFTACSAEDCGYCGHCSY